jgi:hypothetical protein
VTPRREVLVGVDLGTTETKALVTAADGTRLGAARRATAWSTLSGGRVETSGAVLVAGVVAAVAEALADARARCGGPLAVVGIGVAGLAESGVVIDARGRELSPVIAWYDNRGDAELLSLDADFLTAFPARTGLVVGPQWTLAKLLWMRRGGLSLGPGTRWLNVPEFVAYTLCGEQVAEPSLASRTGLLDQATGEPWDAALEVLGVADDFMPPLLSAGQPAGRVRTSAVPELVGAVVTVAGHDHPVAAVGAGAIGPQDLFDSCGTAEVVLRSVAGDISDAERRDLVALGLDVGRHALPGHRVLIGGMRSGLLMRGTLSLVGADDPAIRDALDRRWRPGEGWRDVLARDGHALCDNDVTSALRAGVDPDAAWAATLARIADDTSALLSGMERVVGRHRRAIAAGGWTRMRSVRTSKAHTIPDLTFCPVDQPGTYGAALFAACAAYEPTGIEAMSRRFAAALRRADPADPAAADFTYTSAEPPSTGPGPSPAEPPSPAPRPDPAHPSPRRQCTP